VPEKKKKRPTSRNAHANPKLLTAENAGKIA